MAQSFYFYDLETSGFNPRTARIMQFGGQRTDMQLNSVGKPDNVLIKMTPDILPEPDAVLVTGITPQQTLGEGISEAEFIRYFAASINKPDTIYVGYNSVRFDDEFMRFTMWRNFYDAYQWQWKNGSSRWDLLDVARITRALRPEGIKWPFASDGRPSNSLGLLSGINKLDHSTAHDALSDVMAAVALARLIKSKQPKLFEYLLNLRDKKQVAPLVEKGDPFVYTSGRYPSEFEKTTIVVMLARQPERNAALVYDLRTSPTEFAKMTPGELAARWSDYDKNAPYFPVKLLSYNRVPAIAPLSVLDKDSSARLKIDKKVIGNNLRLLQSSEGFSDKLLAALQINQPKRQRAIAVDELLVDEQLYDGFISGDDKLRIQKIWQSAPEGLSSSEPNFKDDRLSTLFPLYKARNYPKLLSSGEQQRWEAFRSKKLLHGGDASKASRYFSRIEELKAQPKLLPKNQYLLEELNLYGQSILPTS